MPERQAPSSENGSGAVCGEARLEPCLDAGDLRPSRPVGHPGARRYRVVMAADDQPQPASRRLTAVDVPAIAAALLDAFGDILQHVRATAGPTLQHVARHIAHIVTSIDGEGILDGLADIADRGMVWAGSVQGQKMLTDVDIALLGVRTARFYGDAGIYRPLAPALVKDALERNERDGPADISALLADVAPDSDNWPWISEGLLSSPCLQDRRPSLQDALTCIEHDLWGPAVTALLPIFEGVVSDQAGILEGKRVGLRLDEILAGRGLAPLDSVGLLIARPALRVIDAEIFARRDFAGIAIDDPGMNRHLILHGRTVGFRTREHALRSLMLVVALAELIDGPLTARTQAQPAADATFVDSYGPLAGLRQMGVARVVSGQPVWRTERVLARRAAAASRQLAAA